MNREKYGLSQTAATVFTTKLNFDSTFIKLKANFSEELFVPLQEENFYYKPRVRRILSPGLTSS